MVDVPIIRGRQCGECTLCCKILSIKEIGKPQGTWCSHCAVGRGCQIYIDRPSECATFYCGYLTWTMLGEHWLPAKSKMVVVSELDGTRVGIHVDPGWPKAWRQEPYVSEIRYWAEHAAPRMHQVVVYIGKRAIVALPGRAVDLGVVADDERIVTAEVKSPSGTRLEALKLKADDPRIAGMEPGRVHHTR